MDMDNDKKVRARKACGHRFHWRFCAWLMQSVPGMLVLLLLWR